MIKNSKQPLLVVSDGCGNIFEIPDYLMSGMSLYEPVLSGEKTLIQLPHGSDLFELPGRVPVGYDVRKNKFAEVHEYQGKPVYAVAAFMAPAYVQYYRSAYRSLPDAPRLPLYSYTAVGWYRNSFYAAGARIDPDRRHDPDQFMRDAVERKAGIMLKRFQGNRLVKHLVDNCVLSYHCPNAQNFVMERWECPVPVSTACNAGCVGCISKQPSASGIPSSQERLSFTPSVDEIIAYTVPHLEKAKNSIISFGQGCEGEPLLAGKVVEEAIRAIRKRTSRGVINMNSNGSRPETVERLFAAGLDSIRVSLNSAQKNLYNTYYRPDNYTFEDVIESLRIARKFSRWSSLNYFIFPGLTDSRDEISSLENIITETRTDMIQCRNMNIDPEWYIDVLNLKQALPGSTGTTSAHVGIDAWITHIKNKFPRIKLGYFNPYNLERMNR